MKKGLTDYLSEEIEDKPIEQNSPEKDSSKIYRKNPDEISKQMSSKVKPKAKKEQVINSDSKEFTKSFLNDLDENIEKYKKNFQLESNNAVKLCDVNYDKLKRLKATDVTMIHFVNFLISKVVNSKEYKKYIDQ
jgi:hypothetical protein